MLLVLILTGLTRALVIGRRRRDIVQLWHRLCPNLTKHAAVSGLAATVASFAAKPLPAPPTVPLTAPGHTAVPSSPRITRLRASSSSETGLVSMPMTLAATATVALTPSQSGSRLQTTVSSVPSTGDPRPPLFAPTISILQSPRRPHSASRRRLDSQAQMEPQCGPASAACPPRSEVFAPVAPAISSGTPFNVASPHAVLLHVIAWQMRAAVTAQGDSPRAGDIARADTQQDWATCTCVFQVSRAGKWMEWAGGRRALFYSLLLGQVSSARLTHLFHLPHMLWVKCSGT
jgi:hypothetical protein